MAVALLLLVILLISLTGVSLVAGFALFGGETESEPTPVAAEPTPRSRPALPPPQTQAPTPEPAPVATPEPTPEPAPPSIAPVPAPEEAIDTPPSTGTILVEGVTGAVLVGSEGQYDAGQPVPVGSWQVLVDFGGKQTEVGTVELGADQVVTVTCNQLLASCTVP